MAFKKDSWFVRGILILAIAALAAGSVAFAFGGRAANRGNHSAPTQATEDQAAQLQGTIDGYTAVLEREPDNQTALIGIIEAKIALDDLEGTVEPLERLANLNPEVAEYSIALAQTKQQLDDLEGAAQVYRRVLTQTPGSVPALEGLVALLISQERTEAAVGLLNDTLASADQNNEIAPGSIDKLSVKLLLGQVFVEQQRLDDALKMYDEAIADAKTVSPTQPDFRPTLAKGLVLQEKGETTEAKALFDEALALAPTQYKDGVQQLINEKTAPPADEAAESEAAEDEAAEGEATGDAPDAPPAE
ncbi:MAG: tetratricopeptide repeat protein [Cyanobacteria bacterium P01_A01_bin.116]